MIRFEGRNPRAEQWIKQASSRLITEIVDDQREAIRLVIEAGMADGRNPRDTALDLVGRLDKATGRREGGIIGLTSRQADAVIRARRELHNLDANYFTRQRRDKRFDGLVKRAIRDGEKLSQADIDRITGRYKDRMLQYRAEVIARTETLASLQAGKMEAMRQMIDAGKLSESQVKKRWRATGDARTRDSHAAMNNQVVPFRQPFVTPTGYMMAHPHDNTMGAPASETIQCRCYMEWDIEF